MQKTKPILLSRVEVEQVLNEFPSREKILARIHELSNSLTQNHGMGLSAVQQGAITAELKKLYAASFIKLLEAEGGKRRLDLEENCGILLPKVAPILEELGLRCEVPFLFEVPKDHKRLRGAIGIYNRSRALALIASIPELEVKVAFHETLEHCVAAITEKRFTTSGCEDDMSKVKIRDERHSSIKEGFIEFLVKKAFGPDYPDSDAYAPATRAGLVAYEAIAREKGERGALEVFKTASTAEEFLSYLSEADRAGFEEVLASSTRAWAFRGWRWR